MLGVISLAIYHISNVGSCSNTATEFQPMSNERIGLNCLYVFMRWFASFFSNWSQLVCVNEYRSVPFFVTSKVPQCSQLGPSLFSIFIYNFTDCFKFSRILWCANDLKILKKILTVLDCIELQKDALAKYCDYKKENEY